MSGTIGLPPIPLYLAESANESADAVAASRANAQTFGLISYFQKAAPSLKTPQALLGDYKALQVVVGAFGIGSAITAPAIVKQLLTQDPTSKTSLAYRLGNPKYLAFAQAFSQWKTPPFATPKAVASIVSAFQTNSFESNANTQSPGLQNALYFTRQIGSVKDLTQLQADPNLLAVVVTGIGLPLTNFQLLSFTQQTAMLKNKVNFAQFKNPTYVKQIAEQYLVSQQLQTQANTTVAPGSLLSLFGGSDSSGNSLLTILQSGTSSSSSVTGTSTAGSVLSLFA